MDADPGGEHAESLEDLEELLVCDAIGVLLALWFGGKEFRELLVEVDEVLRILAALGFVLRRRIRQIMITTILKGGRTLLRRDS